MISETRFYSAFVLTGLFGGRDRTGICRQWVPSPLREIKSVRWTDWTYRHIKNSDPRSEEGGKLQRNRKECHVRDRDSSGTDYRHGYNAEGIKDSDLRHQTLMAREEAQISPEGGGVLVDPFKIILVISRY